MKYRNMLLKAAILGLYPFALAEITTFSPSGHSDILYSVTVPAETASSGSGPLLFQIKAPTTYEWVGVGQGTQMAGSSIFILYSSSSSENVTISPRSGRGHVEPEYSQDAQISLLEGSGIENGTMTANVRCDTCSTSSSSSWIFAYKKGSLLASDSLSADISLHDGYGSTNVDLSNAISTSANPFLSYNASSNVTDLGGGGSGGAGTDNVLIAHGFIMSIAFVILFPTFALLTSIPMPGIIAKVHAPLQIFALVVVVAGMGLGIKLGLDNDNINDVHPILGLVVIGLLILLQPAMGLLQHLHFRQTGGKSLFTYLHRWLGRVLIILGIVTGGLGFRLAGIGSTETPEAAVIAYSVIAGVMGLFYLVIQVFRVVVQGRRRERDTNQERKKSLGSSTIELTEVQ